MAFGVPAFWLLAATVSHLAGMIAAIGASASIYRRRERYGQAGMAIVCALALTAAWCLGVAVTGPTSVLTGISESLRNLAWLLAALRLFASDGRHTTVRPVRWVVMALNLVVLLNASLLVMAGRLDPVGARQDLIFHVAVMLRLLMAVGGLVLVHNLYVGASPATRATMRWPAAALALVWGFDLNLYTIAYLGNHVPLELATLRGLVSVVSALLLTLGVSRGSAEFRFLPSRAAAFQSFSLLLIGAYLLGMVGIAQWLSYVGGDFARMMQFGFLAAASVAAMVLLPSRRLRNWLRVMMAKHLFQHRYDYRAEWLRFTRTIGRGGENALPLHERVVQSLADITDSPAGLLLAPAEGGELSLAARWQWPMIDVPAEALPRSAMEFFECGTYIVDLDDLRAGIELRGESAIVPAWLRDDPRAWALVPLLHYDRLAGVVVLARPSHDRKLDWEDFDLLRVVSQQLASYLAESMVQEALAESSRFDDFHRRIAFVMHDIKNLASQLSLLARNAEVHAEKPDFRADMLVTLRNSADKLNTLLARLSRYGKSGVDEISAIAAHDVAEALVEHFRSRHPVLLTECQPCRIAANRETLDQVLGHLVQNAIDASAPDSPVFLSVSSDGLHGRFEVLDSGEGMSAEFVRTRLFKPFVSTKQGGFGIGAFEARELVRSMKGRIDVESREGLGSRFIVRLPLAAATDLLNAFGRNGKKVA